MASAGTLGGALQQVFGEAGFAEEVFGADPDLGEERRATGPTCAPRVRRHAISPTQTLSEDAATDRSCRANPLSLRANGEAETLCQGRRVAFCVRCACPRVVERTLTRRGSGGFPATLPGDGRPPGRDGRRHVRESGCEALVEGGGHLLRPGCGRSGVRFRRDDRAGHRHAPSWDSSQLGRLPVDVRLGRGVLGSGEERMEVGAAGEGGPSLLRGPGPGSCGRTRWLKGSGYLGSRMTDGLASFPLRPGGAKQSSRPMGTPGYS